MNTTRALLTAALLALAAPALAAKYYKWVDENGVTHYDTRPPQGGSAEEVRTRRSASSDQPEALERLRERRQAEARDDQGSDQGNRQPQPAAGPVRYRKEECDQYRRNVDTLENKPVVRAENPDTGEMEVIDQERRARMLERSRAAVQACDQQGVK
ncbi:DUF4124 domain-containing protein [Alloalcanivorax gelatiniphagus]|uniref:DUF4124 domain-containing protein n=1 Tax=Alloalcanivorax gelatiniphagus TaxID=1194167 RepID=A0ABY2XQH5_9GAMM|nr:DUF4124 domain-containing protein [Alloalcanivorax gelatiniphagus]TMW15008.1 DUF4124 domain-containing protein [Alloalcanivorax gelatiniphagus]|tara:strand:+ start:15931 stop:16398 length:468 start_codon:yes stop_codon:yes gene_type:complete